MVTTGAFLRGKIGMAHHGDGDGIQVGDSTVGTDPLLIMDGDGITGTVRALASDSAGMVFMETVSMETVTLTISIRTTMAYAEFVMKCMDPETMSVDDMTLLPAVIITQHHVAVLFQMEPVALSSAIQEVQFATILERDLRIILQVRGRIVEAAIIPLLHQVGQEAIHQAHQVDPVHQVAEATVVVVVVEDLAAAAVDVDSFNL